MSKQYYKKNLSIMRICPAHTAHLEPSKLSHLPHWDANTAGASRQHKKPRNATNKSNFPLFNIQVNYLNHAHDITSSERREKKKSLKHEIATIIKVNSSRHLHSSSDQSHLHWAWLSLIMKLHNWTGMKVKWNKHVVASTVGIYWNCDIWWPEVAFKTFFLSRFKFN